MSPTKRSLRKAFPIFKLSIKAMEKICFGHGNPNAVFRMTDLQYAKLVRELLLKGFALGFFPKLVACGGDHEKTADLICEFFPEAEEWRLGKNGFSIKAEAPSFWRDLWFRLTRRFSFWVG